MTILIGAIEFQGPFEDLDYLSDVSGIYALLCHNDGEHELLELGESEFVREHIQNHPDRYEWLQNGLDVSVCVHYTSDLSPAERWQIKESLEREFDEIEVAA